jgi:AcrR family transcriptional regulator
MARPPSFDRRRVLVEALALADEEGLDALTMAGVAARLEVTAMALYRSVRDKADLVDGLVEVLLTEFPAVPAGRPWAERLRILAGHIRQTARRHPSVFPLLLTRPVVTDAALGTRQVVYDALAEAGVAASSIPRVERLVSTAVLGFAVSEVSGRFGRASRELLDEDFDALLTMMEDLIAGEAGRGRAASPGPADLGG